MTRAARFEAFVREYQDMVFATAVRLLGRPEDAEDVAQTVFLRAYERFDRVVESPTAPGWLKLATRNLCLNHLARDRARWRLFSEMPRGAGSHPADEHPVGCRVPSGCGAAAQERALTARDRDARLEQAVRDLPSHQRIPLVLFHFEEMSYAEIAGALDVSLAKLKTDMHRGRLALRKALASLDGDWE